MLITRGLSINGDVTIGDAKILDPFLWLNNSVTRYSANMDGGAAAVFASNSFLSLNSTCTVEYFFRASSSRGANATLISGGNGGNQILFVTIKSDGTIAFGPKHHPALGGGIGALSNSKIQSNKWYHVAQVITNGNLKVYINGINQGLTGDTTGWNSTPPAAQTITIGNHVGSGYYYMLGDIHSLRIINNVALYTGNFTPSFNPLTAVSAGSTGEGVTGTVSEANISLLAFYTSPVTTAYLRSGYTQYTQNVVTYPNRSITTITSHPWQQALGILT